MTLLDYADRYPDGPGFKEATTSRDAADSMKGETGRLRRKVLTELTVAAGTADELAERIGETILATRPRLTELLRLGKVRDTGARRANASGRSAKVWALTGDAN